jgi:hypothetical protein
MPKRRKQEAPAAVAAPPAPKRRRRGKTRDVILPKAFTTFAFDNSDDKVEDEEKPKIETPEEFTYGAVAKLKDRIYPGEPGVVVDVRRVPQDTEPDAELLSSSSSSSSSSAVVCWWDSHPFVGKFVGCPCKFHERRSKTYEFVGCFCSWNCAIAYGMRYLSQNQSRFLGTWIRHLRSQIGDKSIPERLVPAPHWSILKRFGGFMDIATYRSLHCMDLRLSVWPEHMHIMHTGFDCFIECPYIPIPRDALLHVRKVVSDKAVANDHWNFPATYDTRDKTPKIVYYGPPKFDPKRLRKSTTKAAKKYAIQRAKKQPNMLVKVLGLKASSSSSSSCKSAAK